MKNDVRDQKILDLNNSGKSNREIALELNISKSTVNKVLNDLLLKDEGVSPKEVVPIKLDGDEQRFTSFVGYERVDVNVYVHKETGEMVKVAYVRAKSPDDFGYFVRLKD